MNTDVIAYLNQMIEKGEIILCDPLPRTKEYCERAVRKMNEKVFSY